MFAHSYSAVRSSVKLNLTASKVPRYKKWIDLLGLLPLLLLATAQVLLTEGRPYWSVSLFSVDYRRAWNCHCCLAARGSDMYGGKMGGI